MLDLTQHYGNVDILDSYNFLLKDIISEHGGLVERVPLYGPGTAWPGN